MTIDQDRLKKLEKQMGMLTTHPVFSKFLQGGPFAIPASGMLLGGRRIVGGDPSDGQGIVWNAVLERFEPQDLPSNGGDTHPEEHTIVSHDTTATGTELTELTDGSTTTLHAHAGGGGTHPVDLAADVTGILDEANIDSAIARDSELHTKYTDADAITAVPFVEYIPFGSEPITGQSYAP